MKESERAKARELRKELSRLVKLIVEEEFVAMEIFDQALRVLSDLKDLMLSRSTKHSPKVRHIFPTPFACFEQKPSQSPAKDRPPASRSKIPHQPPNHQLPMSALVPEFFLCPISRQIMKDPVTLSSGLTFERIYVETSLKERPGICPATDEILAHSYVIPNLFARKYMSDWFKDHGMELELDPINESYQSEEVTSEQRAQVGELLEKISSGCEWDELRKAIHELRMLTKWAPGNRSLIGDYPKAIAELSAVLKHCKPRSDMRDDVVATMLNFSIPEENKKIVGDDPDFIASLIGSIRASKMQTRANAAAAICSLSALESNRAKIGECEMRALEALGELLLEGDLIAKKDATQAIYLLCMLPDNRPRAVKEGALRALLKTLKDGQFVDEVLSILILISSGDEAAEILIENHGVPEFLQLLKDCNDSRNQENLAVILFHICQRNSRCLREVRAHEEANGTLAHLVAHGTARARKRAAAILEKLNRD